MDTSQVSYAVTTEANGQQRASAQQQYDYQYQPQVLLVVLQFVVCAVLQVFVLFVLNNIREFSSCHKSSFLVDLSDVLNSFGFFTRHQVSSVFSPDHLHTQ